MTEIDECEPNPCENGGTCTDGINSYTCKCVDGYTGVDCATGMTIYIYVKKVYRIIICIYCSNTLSKIEIFQ